ncbi:ABC transporter permease [Pararobbsia silviterrae]|uniref:ABC transporter permease n=1 Tax=Pararobbsia silviterrae TaxID=1792498 RepID=A0A494XMD5_9BURK|nr:ABC transporter permease [Pararobbsia silviterrae]RKP51865.1 ABC transporter permease [Pararobbsia silviterrae]
MTAPLHPIRDTRLAASLKNPLRSLAKARELALLLLIVAIMIVMSVISPNFLTPANFRAFTIGLAPTAIISVGMTVLLVSGGFDLSVGSVLALSGTVAAMLMLHGVPISVAVLLTLVLGVAVGIANGWLVTKVGVNPLVATLGTMSVARGAALVLTDGFSISGLPDAFGYVGSASVSGVPMIVLIMLVVVAIGDVALRHSRYLRQVYYIGANENAAKLSGIFVDRVRTVAYALTSVLAALSGILLASRLDAGTPTAGNALELQVLAAAVIGGARLGGGAGTVLGAFLGVVFVGLINNAMTMLQVSALWQMVVTGVILVAAVALDRVLQRRAA